MKTYEESGYTSYVAIAIERPFLVSQSHKKRKVATYMYVTVGYLTQ